MHHPLLWRAAGPVADGEPMQSPVWGPVTATLDWCEENYLPCRALSFLKCETYVAEYWNVVSSLAMSLLGLYGAVRGARLGLEPRMVVGYLALVVVGLGSAAFHGTLLLESQALDELPMLLGNAVFLYCLTPNAWRVTARRRFAVAAALGLVFCAVTAVYLLTHNALFFEVSYGVGAVLLVYRCSLWAYRNRAERNPRAAPARRVVLVGTLSMLVAFALWNVENTFCLPLRAVRRAVGPRLEWLFQLHAWWHLLASLAAYHLGVFCSAIDPDEDPELGVVPSDAASAARHSARLAGKRRAASGARPAFEIAYTAIGLPVTVPASSATRAE